MLQLFDQVDRDQLEKANDLMTNWRRWGELRKKRIMSPTWIVMNSIRNHSGHKNENEEGFASSNPWDFSEMPDEILALRVEALFCQSRRHLWGRNYYDRQNLLVFYERAWPVPVLIRKFRARNYEQVRHQMIQALRIFITIYQQEEKKCSDSNAR